MSREEPDERYVFLILLKRTKFTMAPLKRWPIVLSNYAVQLLKPDIKIFFIGFNKCATTSIHYMMAESGIWSDHWQRKHENIALRIDSIIDNKEEFRRYTRKATAYSDLSYFSSDKVVEGNSYFKQFHEAYPKAYFVLNDRDVDGWIRSRAGHRKGTLLERSAAFYRADAQAVKEIWRESHARHVKAVLAHFSGHDRFLHFYVDRDPPALLTSFLAPTFRIDANGWQKVNASRKLAAEG
jgi:hypothetical protein